jgi:hypothetical protein
MNISKFCFLCVISLIFYFVCKSIGDGAKCQTWCAFCLARILFHFLLHIYTLPVVPFQSALVVDLYCLYFVLNIQDLCSNPIGNYTVVSELLKCGYRSLEAKNQEGQTAVHLASRMGKDDILKKLIESGANINCRDTAGYTPLHVGSLLIVCQEYFDLNCSTNQFVANICDR